MKVAIGSSQAFDAAPPLAVPSRRSFRRVGDANALALHTVWVVVLARKGGLYGERRAANGP
jgi:hypothetical protein